MSAARVEIEHAEGALHARVVAISPEAARAAGEIACEAARAARPVSRAADLAGRPAWIKGDQLPGAARWRHSLARLAGADPPALREHAALTWLRSRLFRAPEPLAAAIVVRRGWVRYQLLASERLEAHAPLSHVLRGAGDASRRAWLGELARETARMHALHFVHRDLHFRNVLVRTSTAPDRGDPRALAFVDARRGGHPLPRRDAAYDLACIYLEAPSVLTPAEGRDFFATYVAELAAQGRAVDRQRLAVAVSVRRAALVRRIARDPARWRLPEALVREWDPADVACGGAAL